MIFIDSDFYIGLYHRLDFHHRHCLELKDKIDKEELITSFEVVNEVATKMSYFLTKEVSLVFLNDIIKQKILVIYPDNKVFNNAKKIFQGIVSKKVSLTDCINMAIAKDKGIKYFLSFDKIYEKCGFKLIK